MERRQVKYVNTAALWRDLAYLRANRERLEEFSAEYSSATGKIPPFNYHEHRREILEVLAARTKKAA